MLSLIALLRFRKTCTPLFCRSATSIQKAGLTGRGGCGGARPRSHRQNALTGRRTSAAVPDDPDSIPDAIQSPTVAVPPLPGSSRTPLHPPARMLPVCRCGAERLAQHAPVYAVRDAADEHEGLGVGGISFAGNEPQTTPGH